MFQRFPARCRVDRSCCDGLPFFRAGKVAAAGPASVDAARLTAAEDEPGQWMAHGRTYTVSSGSARSIRSTQRRSGSCRWRGSRISTVVAVRKPPLVVDGVLYVSTAWSKVKAYDADRASRCGPSTPVPGEWAVNACCDVVNRGVAVWQGKVFVGSFDGRLIALDAATGQKLWDVNTIDRTKPCTITGAPAS